MAAPLPTVPEARAIRNFLRPDFELIVAKGVSVGRIEEKLLRLNRRAVRQARRTRGQPSLSLRRSGRNRQDPARPGIRAPGERRWIEGGSSLLQSTSRRMAAGADQGHRRGGRHMACDREAPHPGEQQRERFSGRRAKGAAGRRHQNTVRRNVPLSMANSLWRNWGRHSTWWSWTRLRTSATSTCSMS